MLYFSKWKIGLIVAVVLAGIFYALPNMLPPSARDDLPEWWQPVTLGLDLQGGSHLLLEVGVDAVVAEQTASLLEAARTGLREARVRYLDLAAQDGAVTVRIPDAAEREQAREVLRKLDGGVQITDGEDGRYTVGYSEAVREERVRSAVQRSIEIVRRRVDELGTREPTIQRQGEQRIIVEVPGLDDPERLKRLIGQTAQLNFHLIDHTADVEDALRGRVPPGSRLMAAAPSNPGPSQYVVRRRIEVAGERLTDAQVSFQDNQPVVSFRFDTVGGRQFGRATQENVGRQLSIVLDNQVISAPVIREPILGGSGIISGSFSTQEAQDLALLLRAGALPAPLTILEERTVGPGLGADSIQAGAFASALGMVLVVIFMVLAYGRFGVYANIALVLNLCMLLGALSVFGATLTLPGIAGIVLTVGMAVDANVLIFERIREEVRNGRTVFNAAETGFRQAMKTIIDSNITTLAAAVLLFSFGSGPVRGFAVTLGFGILTSMFTAVMVTRLLVAQWLRRSRPQTLAI
ncbi:protein translocase subunit SecD [Novispirillum sp. DQ9]|uniref:protein translocase subunit SecD n=1 Tax=Novispirillum sp. DQ9 TaxID=3398612 RepID=UPI003C79D35D